MDRQFIAENQRERERLKKLVEETTDEDLKLTIYKEGWTIAVVMAHLAFGDQRTLALIKKWKASGFTREPPTDIDPINDGLLPLFLLISPRAIADLAVSSSETLDRELEGMPNELVEAMEKLAPNRLDRSVHRKRHLDEIEALLKLHKRI